jgi:hypothetical protein
MFCHLYVIYYHVSHYPDILQLQGRLHIYVECASACYIIIIIISSSSIIIGSTALGWPWPPQANVASNLYPGDPPANFHNPVSLHLPLPHQSIMISVSYVLFDLQDLSTISV